MIRTRHVVLLAMIAIAAGARVVDHPWNLAPVGAVALFAGAHFRERRWAFAAPLAAMFLADLALGLRHHNLGFYTFHPALPVVYACYALYVLLGFWIRSRWDALEARRPNAESDMPAHSERIRALADKGRRVLPVATATLAGAVAFFVITNFADWLLYYERTWAGLVRCYTLAIPFFRTTLAGDIAFTILLFGGYALLRDVCERSEVPEHAEQNLS